AASGLVVIYRGTRVFNLAQGAIAMFGAYLFSGFVDGGIPLWPAFVLATVLCGLVGVVIERALMRPLGRSGPGAQVVATLGVFITLQAAVIFVYGNEPRASPNLASQGTIEVPGNFNISYSQLVVLLLALVMFALLYLLYKRTNLGLQMQAVAGSPEAAALQGVDVGRISMVSWAIGCMCAGVTGIMLAPLLILDTVGLPLIVIQSFAAALIGGLVSFPLTLVGALVLGLAESTSTAFVQTQGTKQLIAFVLIVIALTIRKNPLHEAVSI
ncbi:MAG: branched-chain amino acid ABC transporter permease, partial [Acidimicrobiia bacterium]